MGKRSKGRKPESKAASAQAPEEARAQRPEDAGDPPLPPPVRTDVYGSRNEASDWGFKLETPFVVPERTPEPPVLAPASQPSPPLAAVPAAPLPTAAAEQAVPPGAPETPRQAPLAAVVAVDVPRTPAPVRSVAERLAALGGAAEDARKADNRRSVRRPFRVRVQYEAVGRSGLEDADNLSVHGMFVRTPTPLEVGDAVMVNFSVPGRTLPFSLAARVKWVTAYGSPDAPHSGMGLEFIGVDPHKQRTLEGILQKLGGA